MGFKAMNLAPGRGVRYQVHLYRIETGELLAIMDAQHLTTLRTGATSAVATRRLAPARKMQMALLGSGAEARAQLEAMTVAGLLRRSGSSVRRPRTASGSQRSSATGIGLDARDVASAEEGGEGRRARRRGRQVERTRAPRALARARCQRRVCRHARGAISARSTRRRSAAARASS